MTAPTQLPVQVPLPLFGEKFEPLRRPDPADRPLTIEEQFRRFHEANPHVARILAQMALDLKRRGREHFGMKALFEALRYYSALQTEGDEWKLNNNHTSFYARLLMDRHPELEDFFEIRERRGN
jgi:hypothetical protein